MEKKSSNNDFNKNKKEDDIYNNDTSLTQEQIYIFKPELKPNCGIEGLFRRKNKFNE